MAIEDPNKKLLGVEGVDAETGLTEEAIPVFQSRIYRAITPPRKVTYPGAIPSAYERILGEGGYYPEIGQERLQETLARRQSSAGQFVNMLNQAVVGEIVGGTIEGLGYLLDIPQYRDIALNTEQEWGNLISDIGKSLKTWTEDVSPIYRDPNAADFAPGDWSWWMKNFKSVASTLSLMIPAVGTIKGLGMLGKALGIAKNIGARTQWIATGISTAMTSRHIENLMESSQLYDERYKDNIALGMSDKEAKQNASVAAANAYRLNWVMIMQDIPQYLLFGGFGKTGKAATERMINATRKMGLNTTPLFARKGASIAFDMLGEGGEEAYQYIVQQESAYLSKRAVNQAVESSLSDRLSGYVREGEMWTNAWFGAIGAGVMQAGRAGFAQITASEQTKQKLDFIGSLGAQAKRASDQVRFAIRAGDPQMIETAKVGWEKAMFEKGAQTDNLHNVRTFIEQVAQGDPADLENHKVEPDDVKFIQENKDDLLADLDIFEGYLKEASDQGSRYAHLIAGSRLFLSKYNAVLNNFKKQAAQSKKQQLAFLEKSPQGRLLIEKEWENKTWSKLITELTKQRSRTKKDGDEYKGLTSRITFAEAQLAKNKEDIKVARVSRTKDEKIIDDAFKLNISEWKKYHNINSKIKHTEQAIAIELSNLELYESGVDLADTDAIDKYAETKRDQAEERSEFAFEIDDLVDYTNEENILRSKVIGYDQEQDAPRYIVQPIDEKGKEIGDPIVVDADSLSKVIEKDSDDISDEVDEEYLTDEEKVKYNDGGGLVNLQQSIAYVRYDPNKGEYIINNEEFNEWISTASSEELTNAKVVFKFGKPKEGTYEAGFFDRMREKHGAKIVDKVESGKPLTNKEAYELLKAEDEVFDSFVDGATISIEVNGIGGEINMHVSDWYNIQIPPEVERKGEIAKNLHKTNKFNETRAVRRNILYNLLRGIKVKSKGVTRTKGFPKTRAKTQKNRNRNVATALNKPVGKIKFAIGTRGNEALIAPREEVATPLKISQPGSVYVPDDRTLDGGEGLIKMNKQKIRKEHAEILFDAFMLRYQKGLGYQTKFPDDRVEGLTIGEVIELLAYNGRKNTSPYHRDNEGHMSLAMELSQLYVIHEGNTPVLYFGGEDSGGGSVQFSKGSDMSERRVEFVAWATKYKNYAVYLTHLTTNKRVGLGIELNKRFNRKFRVGTKDSIEHKGRGTYTSFLINSEMVMSDVEMSKATGTPFHAPVTEFNSNKLVKANGAPIDTYSSDVKETPKIEEGKEDIIVDIDENADPEVLDENLSKAMKDIMGDDNVTRIKTSDEFISYTPETLEEERKYIADRLGISKKEIKSVDKFIEIIKSGKLAHALYTHDSITLYKGGEVGTLYHEAFHRVSLGYLTPEERNAIHRSARIIYKIPKATFKETEEKLAEEFRLYVIREKTNKPTKLHSKIAKFFENLYDYIVTFFAGEKRLNNYEVDNLFEDISRGKFRYSKILARNEKILVNESFERLIADTEFTEVDTRAQYVEIVKGLAYYLINLNKINDLNNVSKLSWDPVITKLEKIKDTFKRVAEDNKYPEKSRNDALRIASLYENLLGEKNVEGVYEKFNSLIEAVNIYLSSLGIVAKYESDKLDFEERDAAVKLYDTVSYAISSKDTALASIKFMIATLRESRELRSYSGMPSFIDFNKSWSTIMYDLHNIETIEEVLLILNAKKDVVPFYKDLIDKLTSAKPGTEILRTQFVRTVRKHKHDFINFLYTTDKKGPPTFEISNADTQRASRLETLMWSEAFYLSDLVEDRKEEKPKIKKEFKKIQDDAIALKEDVNFEFNNNDKSLLRYDEYFDKILNLLKSVSISIDDFTLQYALDREPGDSRDDKLRHYVSAVFVNIFIKSEMSNYFKGTSKVSIFRLHINEHQVKRLADAQIRTHPELMKDTILGPGGNPFYTYAPHSHATHEIKKLKTDKEYVTKRLGFIGNKNSHLLEQMLDDDVRDNVSIKTMSALASRGGLDRVGRNYEEITRLEDYLIKFVASHNNLFNMSTMADKGVYYFLAGFNTFNDLLEVEKGELVISNKVLDIFEGYYKDEVDRIDEVTKLKQAYNDAETVEIKQAILDRLVLNYHYTKLTDTGIPDWKGNAFKFQHFKEFNKKRPADIKEVRNAIREILQKRFKSEVNNINQLQIILQDKGGEYNNKLLDGGILERFKKHYKNESLAIKSAIAIHTINTMIASFETEKMFMGDSAFYTADKRGQTEDDKFKRYGILTGTGDQFAKSVRGYGSELLEHTYSVSTVKTQTFSSFMYDALLAKFIELGVNEDLAKNKLNGYLEVDPTDGQTFITPEMYRQMMIRLGEWSDDVEKSYVTLISTKVLSKSEELVALGIVMNPIKPVYFGLHPSNIMDYVFGDNIEIPIYDKMASAVLFDRVVKGTHLQEVLNRMRAVDKYENLDRIDMLKFDSAVKVGGMKSKELYDNATERNEINDLTDMLVFNQNWSGLRRQNITDPHEAGDIKVGTQVVKVSTSNIVKDGAYGSFGSGIDIIKDIHASISANSDIGLEEVKSDLGYQDGEIHDAKFLATLRSAAVRTGKSEDFRRALRIGEDNKPYLHMDAFPDREWLQTRIVSIVSKGAVDIKFPGNQLIQVSNYGFKGPGVSELKFLQLTKGATLIYKMEARLSIKLFKDVIPNYDKLTHEDRVKFIRGKPEIIGYRIPTQGQNSVVVLKIVDLLPDNSGDAIQLPLEFTVLTGSDFDIDKLYIMRKNYRIVNNKLTKIQFDTDENAAPRYKDKVRELFWIHRDNPSVFTKELLNKIDHIDIYKNHVKGLVGDQKTNVKVFRDKLTAQHNMYKKETDAGRKNALYNNILNTITQIRSFVDETNTSNFVLEATFDEHYEHIRGNLVSLNLIPDTVEEFAKWSIHKQNTKRANQNRLMDAFIAVLTNDRHFVGATTPLGVLTKEMKALAARTRALRGEDRVLDSLESDTPTYMSDVKDKYIGGKGGIGPFALSNVHHTFTQHADVTMEYVLDYGNTVEGGQLDLSQIYGKDETLITDWLSALIDSHVDIAKDPYVMDLNINPATYNAVELMIRSGFGGMTTIKYMAQPIMFDYAKVFRNTMGSIKPEGTDIYTQSEARRIALDKVFAKWFNKAGKDIKEDKVDNYLVEDIFKDEFLEKGIIKPTNATIQAKEQLKILDYFKNYLIEPSELLTEFVQVSQIDTKRFGNNFIEIFTFNNRVKELIGKKRINNIEKFFPMFEGVKDPLFISKMYENSVNIIMDIFSSTSIQSTDMFTSTVGDIMAASKTGSTTNVKLARTVSKELFASLVSKFFTSSDYLNVTSNQLSNLFHGKGSLFSQLIDIKNGTLAVPKDVLRRLEKNPFVQMLITRFEEDSPSKDIHGFVVAPIQRVRDKWDLDDLVEGWEELLKDKHETIQRFAKNAFIYSFYTSGFTNRLYSFFNFIPTDMVKGITVNDKQVSYDMFIRRLHRSMQDISNVSILMEAKRDFYENNHYDPNFVPVKGVTRITKNEVYSKKKKDIVIASRFKVDGKVIRLLGFNSDSQPLFTPFVKEKDSFWQYVGFYQETERDQIFFEPIYKLVKPKGFKLKGIIFKENGFPANESIVKEHSIPVELTDERQDVVISAVIPGFINVPFESQTVIRDKEDSGYDLARDRAEVEDVEGNAKVKIVDGTVNAKEAARRGDGIYTMRPNEGDNIPLVSKESNFGNPWSKGGYQNTIKVDTIAIAVSNYRAWLREESFIDVESTRRIWILDQISKGVLDGQSLIYFKAGYRSHADELQDFVNERKRVDIEDKDQLYKGGFENKGKGTPQGDGKDKAMRKVADSFIGEVVKENSSSWTSAVEIGDQSGVKPLKSGITVTSLSGDVNVVMLARNGSLKNKELDKNTKESISKQFDKGAEFVVGDMPNVDSQFIDYLQEIGAKFTIYHTGEKSRIQVTEIKFQLGELRLEYISNELEEKIKALPINDELKIFIDNQILGNPRVTKESYGEIVTIRPYDKNKVISENRYNSLRVVVFSQLADWYKRKSKYYTDLLEILKEVFPSLSENDIKVAANYAWAIEESKFDAQEEVFLEGEAMALSGRIYDFKNDWRKIIQSYDLDEYLSKAPFKDVDYSKKKELGFQLEDQAILGEVDYRVLDKLYNRLQVLYPRLEINFRNQPKTKDGKLVLGEANLTAGTVLIDAINQKLDTLPHEYAHHYIAWFRETPMVKEGVRQFGSEEQLVQKIGEQVVKQKGEALNWWTKFTKWVVNLFSDKDILGLLTDAFLTRTDLTKADPILAAAIAKYPAGTITDWNNPYSWGIEERHEIVDWKTIGGKRIKQYNRFTEKKAREIVTDIQAEGGIARIHESENGKYTVEAGMRLDISVIRAKGIRYQLGTEADRIKLAEIFNLKVLTKLKKHREETLDLKPLDRLLSKAKAAFVTKIESAHASGRILEEQRAGDLLTRLEHLEDSPEESLFLLIRQSVKLVDVAFNTVKEWEDNPKKKINAFFLSKWANAVKTFDILDEIESYMTEKFGFDSPLFNRKDADTTRSILREAITKKNYIQDIYVTKGVGLIAEFLAPYYNRIRAESRILLIKEFRKGKGIPEGMTEDEYVSSKLIEGKADIDATTLLLLKNELQIAERDVNIAVRWLDNILDTPDPVVAAMVKAFVLADDKARLENIKMRKVFEERLIQLENAQPNKKFQSSLDFYRFMLEFDKEGKPTGHLLTPHSSALMEEYSKVLEKSSIRLREIMGDYKFKKRTPSYIAGRFKMSTSFVKELINLVEVGKESHAVSKLTKKWKADNTNFKSGAFKEAYWKEIDRLKEEGVITDKDIEGLRFNQQVYKNNELTFSELADQKKITDDAAEALIQWVRKNAWSFRVPKGKWINYEWATFMNEVGIPVNLSYNEQLKILKNKDNAKARWYVFIIDMANEADKMHPYAFRLGTRLPGIGKDTMERAKSRIGFVAHLRESARREFTILPDDLERQELSVKDEHGKIKQYLPVYYTARPTKLVKGKKVFDIDYQSFDLASIYYRYWAAANSYSKKKDILPNMEMAKHFVDTRETMSRSIFDKPIFGKSPFRSSDPEKEEKIAKTERAENISGQLNDFFTMIVYGKKIKDEGKIKIPFFRDTYIDVGKTADAINRYTSINLLAGNFVQGVANVGIGQTMQTIDAIAGEHVNLKIYAKAQKFYWKQLPAMAGDVGLRTPQSLGNLLIEDFYILHELPNDVDFARTNRVSQVMRLSSVFFIQHLGEHSMQGQFLFAMLMNKKAFDSEGKELGNMLDMYIAKDGKLTLDPRVDIEKSHWTPQDQLEFGYRIRGILSRMHGEYGSMGRIALQHFALGRFAYMFRKFVVPGIKRRYGKERYIERLDDFVEGSYRTMFRFAGQLGKDMLSFKYALMTEEWSNLTDHQKANIKRAISEIVFVFAAWILGSMLIKDDDDEYDDWLMDFTAYQAYRLRAELLFFTPKIDEAFSILRSPAAAVSVLENLIKISDQVFTPMEKFERGPWKGQYKMTKYTINMIPFYRQYYKMRDVDEMTKWFR